MEGFLYLIESIDTKRRYLGSTIKPAERIREHNYKKNKSTRHKAPWRCLLVINVGDITRAKKIENYIKKQKETLSIKNIIKIINRYFETGN